MADTCLTDRRWVAILERFSAERAGRFYTCVPLTTETERVGRWHDDTVWFKTHPSHDLVPYTGNEASFASDLSTQPEAVLLSPRGYADRTAFGMLICARSLLPPPVPITPADLGISDRY